MDLARRPQSPGNKKMFELQTDSGNKKMFDLLLNGCISQSNSNVDNIIGDDFTKEAWVSRFLRKFRHQNPFRGWIQYRSSLSRIPLPIPTLISQSTVNSMRSHGYPDSLIKFGREILFGVGFRTGIILNLLANSNVDIVVDAEFRKEAWVPGFLSKFQN